jgi:AraC-like DNA-binding protein
MIGVERLLIQKPGGVHDAVRLRNEAVFLDAERGRRQLAGIEIDRPGSQEILGRLSELLFVEAVRGHIDKLSAEASGWLAALRDPALSRALAALHARPAHAWTAEELAKEACLSRSAFAERFGRVAGLPPMSYLTRWRMLLASQRLRESADTIAQIAAAVGYESESTFSRAFTRQMGIAPGAWRRSGPG